MSGARRRNGTRPSKASDAVETRLGLLQLLLWIPVERDVRRRGLSGATCLALAGVVVPIFGIGICLWYFLDREGFVDRGRSYDPER